MHFPTQPTSSVSGLSLMSAKEPSQSKAVLDAASKG